MGNLPRCLYKINKATKQEIKKAANCQYANQMISKFSLNGDTHDNTPKIISINNLSSEESRLSVLYLPMLAILVLRNKNSVLKNRFTVITIIKGNKE